MTTTQECLGSYNKGCRCQPCTDRHAKATREWRRKHAEGPRFVDEPERTMTLAEWQEESGFDPVTRTYSREDS